MRSYLEISLRSHGDFIWRSWEDLSTISEKIDEIFLKLKIIKKIGNIFIEDPSKISKRF